MKISKARLFWLLRYLIGGCLFFVVFNAAKSFDLVSIQPVLTPDTLVVLLGLKFCAFTAMVLRWQYVLRLFGIQIEFRSAYIFSLMGHAMNYVVPGSVSGDAAKAALLHDKGHSMKRAVTSVLLDRGMGFMCIIALLAISGIASYFRRRDMFNELFGQIAPKIAVGGLIFMLSAALIVFLFRRSRYWATAKEDVKEVCSKWKTFPTLFFLSLVSQTSLIVFYYYACKVMNLSEVDFFAIMFVFSFSSLAIMLPITPGGLGVGQAVFNFLFGLYIGHATNVGALLFTMYQVFDLIFIIPGALLLLNYRHSAEKHTKAIA